ncbi:hypothetical protein TPB0596_33930 [Tsukamurella pulmonis]|uniref:hypothetical protein n=1 Tax=Tsukamurella pulmonis TaxID=47312 RepID=UPI001EDFEBB2|nr:hypothetical protein [Tsukamurella pulmonis]BDD83630.1 hypothetical protein TPB0596_33930 [Tsukamurella pulmonis]
MWWAVYDTALRVLPIAAIVVWTVYAGAAATVGVRRRAVEAVGWTATTLTSLAVLPFVAFALGLLVFLPALWFLRVGSESTVAIVAWAEALLLTVAVLAMGRWAFRRFARARFLSAAVVILGLGSVWMGRFLVTVDWSMGPT